MRSDTYGPYPLPSKNTCGFPRPAGSRWSRPADLPGTYYPDPTTKSATRRLKNFPEEQQCKYQTRSPRIDAFLLQFLRRSYADPRPIPGHVYGTRTEMFPSKTKPSTRRIFIPGQHDRAFIVTGGTSGCGFEVAKALYNLKGRFYVGRMRRPQLQKSTAR